MEPYWGFIYLNLMSMISVFIISLSFYAQDKISEKYSERLLYINSVRFCLLCCIGYICAQFLVNEFYNENTKKEIVEYLITNHLESTNIDISGIVSNTLLVLALIFWVIAIVIMINDREKHSNYNLRLSAFLISSIVILLIPSMLNEINEIFGNVFYFIEVERIHISSIMKGLYIFISLFIALQYLSRILQIRNEDIRRSEELIVDIEGLNHVYNIFSFIFAAIATLFVMGSSMKSLGLFTGAIVAGLTLSFKELIANFVAGILVMWDKSIKKNNVISVENYMTQDGGIPVGVIDKVTLRHTVIKDRNEISILIPNSVLISNPIINWTHSGTNVRVKLDVGISYQSDIDRAMSIMKSEANKQNRVLSYPAPSVNIMGFGESSIDLQLRFFIKDAENGLRNIKSAIFNNIIKRFYKENIEIPFPQSDVHIDFKKNIELPTSSSTDNEKIPVS